jgi:hypothetical protein
MNKLIILTFFTCLFFQEEQTINWSKDLKLEWSDFKGEPKPNGDAVAITASGISFQFSTTKSSSGLVDYSFSIKAQFYPNKSWSIKEPLSNIVLTHERLHFDITEFYARKFRQSIINFKFTNAINNEMQSIHNAIIKELGDQQNKYDAETNHSQNIEKQIEWQHFIKEELNKLSRYGS